MSFLLKSKKLIAKSIEKISERLYTQFFCCVTDIPLMDLELHARYYGKVAIGFKCSSVHMYFNPVLYFPSIKFPRKYHVPEGGCELTVDDYDDIDLQSYDVKELPNGKYRLSLKDPQLRLFATEIESDKIDRFFSNHLKITNFSPHIGESFYQEREWRHISDFIFKVTDVESVIVPNRLKKKVNEFIYNSDDMKHISILTWEFLRMV